MSKLKLRVCRIDRKCFDTQGYWDGTYDDSYEYIICDDEEIEVDGMDGFGTREKAREAGEKRLNELKESYESACKSNGRDCRNN